jgi:hypothetical protein
LSPAAKPPPRSDPPCRRRRYDWLAVLARSHILFTRAVNVDPVGVPVQYLLTRFAADSITLLIESGSARKFRARV